MATTTKKLKDGDAGFSPDVEMFSITTSTTMEQVTLISIAQLDAEIQSVEDFKEQQVLRSNERIAVLKKQKADLQKIV